MANRRRMPDQKPGRSKQNYGTPRDFIAAVERRWGPLDVDLAGTEKNKKAPVVITRRMDSLSPKTLWPYRKRLWLNPPFENIGVWARKCADWCDAMPNHSYATGAVPEQVSRLFFLTPASIGSVWFEKFVYGRALVLGLVGRLTFEGETMPYPKDCMLSVFGEKPRFDLWRWR